MLDASIDVVDGVLTIRMMPGYAVDSLKVSVDDGVYTFRTLGPIVVHDDGGLAVSASGPGTATAAGIDALAIVTSGPLGQVTVESTDVPTDIRVESRSTSLQLGAPTLPGGLSKLTGPVSIEVVGDDVADAWLTLSDDGAEGPNDYTITADAVAATGGFGGLTYSGVTYLGLSGSKTGPGQGPSRYAILGVADGVQTYVASHEAEGGRSEFVVDAPGEAPGASLVVMAGSGEATLAVENVAASFVYQAWQGRSRVTISDGGATGGVRGKVVLAADLRGVLDVLVDDSAGTTARDATLAVDPEQPAVGWLRLDGAAGPGGSIQVLARRAERIEYRAPRGLDNALAVDFGVGDPLPLLAGREFAYDGGFDGSPGVASRLTLVGAPPAGPFATQVHETAGAGGTIAFGRDGGPAGVIAYAGLSPDALTDRVAADEYTFRYRGAGDPDLAITAGAEPGTLAIGSRAVPPAFSGVTLANKAHVVVDTGGVGNLATTIDYAGTTPVDGLESLTLVTSPNDPATPVATPPGATFAVEATAPPRPTAISAPAEPITSAPPPALEPAPEPVGPGLPGAGPTPPPPSPALGAAFVARFGGAMRAGPAATQAASPFRNLRAARLAQWAALRARRLERLEAFRATIPAR